MAVDARVRYTKKIIRDSFTELRAQKPLEKITVCELCELAEINRATFYKYYRDVYDLKNQLEEEMLAAALSLVHNADLTTAYDVLLKLTSALYNSKVRYMNLRGAFSPDLMLRITQRSFEDKKLYFSQITKNANLTYDRWQYNYMCTGTAFVMMDWINNGMQETPEEISRFLEKLILNAK